MTQIVLTILIAIPWSLRPAHAASVPKNSCNTLLVMTESQKRIDARQLIYLAAHELDKIRLNLVNGRLRTWDGRPFSSPYKVGLVVSAAGDIFAFSAKDFDRAVRHSSPVHGAPLIFAGDAMILDGTLDWLSNESGHYFTDLRALLGIAKAFVRSGLDLSRTEIMYKPGLRTLATVTLGLGRDVLAGNFVRPEDIPRAILLEQAGVDISEIEFRHHGPPLNPEMFSEMNDFFRVPKDLVEFLKSSQN